MSVPKADLKRWPVKGPSLRELFVGELHDLHDIENRLIKALPKLAKRANSGELRSGLKLIWHKRTSLSVQRGSSRKTTSSWVKRSSGTVMDAALLAAAQRAEHYEIATYGCVRNWPKNCAGR